MDRPYRILVVDDEPSVLALAVAVLAALDGCECVTETDGRAALERVRAGDVDLVVTDVNMPRMSGAELLGAVHELDAEIPVLIMTGYSSVDSAVKLFRQGAYDYITKPFSADELRSRVSHALERLRLRAEVRTLRRLVTDPAATSELVTGSTRMKALLRQLPALAASGAAVLIFGETGTGKEVLARAIHRLSPRASAAFVAVNCAALPETLLESELFGHMKGAFTDATESRTGLVQAAAGGTLFLDEIGEMTNILQVKLLRFLQDHEYRPVGSARSFRADVRVIAATHRDLGRAIQAGTFREDLYYRLNILPITLPPLRERKEDIPLLVAHFLRKLGPAVASPVRAFSPMAIQRLMAHDWPGNVRELENKVQQLLALTTRDVVQPEQIDFPVATTALTTPDGQLKPFQQAKDEALSAFEIQYVTTTLALSGGNISKGARLAGKNRRSFWELVRTHGLRPAGAEPVSEDE